MPKSALPSASRASKAAFPLLGRAVNPASLQSPTLRGGEEKAAFPARLMLLLALLALQGEGDASKVGSQPQKCFFDVWS